MVSKGNPCYVHTTKLMALSPQLLQSSWQWALNRWNRGYKESLGLDRLPQDFLPICRHL